MMLLADIPVDIFGATTTGLDQWSFVRIFTNLKMRSRTKKQVTTNPSLHTTEKLRNMLIHHFISNLEFSRLL